MDGAQGRVMADFKGFVSHIIYRSEESGYTVFEVTLTDVGHDQALDGGEAVSGDRGSGESDGKHGGPKGKKAEAVSGGRGSGG